MPVHSDSFVYAYGTGKLKFVFCKREFGNLAVVKTKALAKYIVFVGNKTKL